MYVIRTDAYNIQLTKPHAVMLPAMPPAYIFRNWWLTYRRITISAAEASVPKKVQTKTNIALHSHHIRDMRITPWMKYDVTSFYKNKKRLGVS